MKETIIASLPHSAQSPVSQLLSAETSSDAGAGCHGNAADAVSIWPGASLSLHSQGGKGADTREQQGNVLCYLSCL